MSIYFRMRLFFKSYLPNLFSHLFTECWNWYFHFYSYNLDEEKKGFESALRDLNMLLVYQSSLLKESNQICLILKTKKTFFYKLCFPYCLCNVYHDKTWRVKHAVLCSSTETSSGRDGWTTSGWNGWTSVRDGWPTFSQDFQLWPA